MKRSAIFAALLISAALSAAEYSMSNIKITVSRKPYKFAGEELKKHLELSGNKLAPGKDALEIFIGKPSFAPMPKTGESHWIYKNGKLYIWGREHNSHPGTLFAVYGFLEEKLGVRWIYPGEDGIYVPQRKTVSFKEGESYSRTAPYFWASIRHGLWHGYNKRANLAPRSWQIAPEKLETFKRDQELFRIRHRNGQTMSIRYAHAFTQWPDRFEKTHPDYFGVGPYGKPFIPPNRSTAKLCLSNPAVIDQIIADWKAKGARKYLNVSPNDGTAGYCLCEKCMALDTRKPGENFYAHLTDRYLNFWNRVAKRAIAINPEVMVTTYVYSYYRFPPRREKIEYPDNMLCGLVPALGEDSGALFEAWKKVGMKHCFLRPNDTHPASAQIRGLEKRIYDKYQASRQSFKLYGVDYDSTLGIKSRDLEHYVLERMATYPDKSFEDIMDEFCSAYGAAAGAVKEFYTGLRPVGEAMYLASAANKRNQQVLDDSLIKVDNNKVYEDFLKSSLKKLEAFPQEKLAPGEKRRFARLLFSIKHNILCNEFKREGDLVFAGKKNNFAAAAKALWDFRESTVKEFPENYPTIIYRSEKRYWNLYQPYRNSSAGDGANISDLAAGWRNSFDEPSLQGWSAREAYKEITNKEASFDRYSVMIKEVKKNTIALFRRAVEVTPGAKYELSFDVKAPKGGNFRLRVTADRKNIASISVKANGGHWVQKKGTFTIPADVKKVTLYLYVSDIREAAYFDNVVLTRLNK